MPKTSQREITLSADRAFVAVLGAVMLATLTNYLAMAGEARWALVTAAIAAAGFWVACAGESEPRADHGPPSEIAAMSDAEFDRLEDAVQRAAAVCETAAPDPVAPWPAPAAPQPAARPRNRSCTQPLAVCRTSLRTDGPAAPSRRRFALRPSPPPPVGWFEALVRAALDELPDFVQAELADNVAVVVSDEGHTYGAYGLYVGGTVAYPDHNYLIYVFRDTLVRDFGADPAELRRQVTITVRHEIAHHLGGDERHVQGLGL